MIFRRKKPRVCEDYTEPLIEEPYINPMQRGREYAKRTIKKIYGETKK